ncbi:hypothetical protein BDU57DRAFT_495919 [Ampelomyces quisqualis]|uniref:EthD domain-containing protein n=1 Tax=Ampelomyces quisqualis TaxID=50730 RepID=A0A6A5QJH3_AMPQU|nr:hypothetical protein BDU57DRAFT_495919 [Ampelomyces quisqualis]
MSENQLVRVTVCARRNPKLTVDEFNDHWLNKHGPLISAWLQTHGCTCLTANTMPYDGIADFWYNSFEEFEKAYEDAYYKSVVKKDEEHLFDMSSLTFTAGVERAVIEDGKMLNCLKANQIAVDQPLNDKILLITGGASGIGLCLAKQAHDIGAKVLVADIKTTPDFDTFAAGKDNILYVQSDVTHWADFNKIFDACEKKWNDVPDAYGICAGLFDPPFSNFWQDPEQDEGYRQVDVNVNHPIKLTRMALRKSLKKGKRAIGFVKSLKDTEPLTGVKITTLCPGGVMTPLFDAQKIKQYSVTNERFLTPQVCATHLLDLLQKKEYPCGSVLEVTLKGTRVIPEWNVPAPEGEGTGQELMSDELVGNLLGPIKKALERDRTGA